MQLSNTDKGYLWDMLDACNDIAMFMRSTTYNELENNKMKRFAVERQLLVVGEAANHISENCRKGNPDIPWKLIIGLRNIIAHNYGEILVDRIFQIAKDNVPELKTQISALLES